MFWISYLTTSFENSSIAVIVKVKEVDGDVSDEVTEKLAKLNNLSNLIKPFDTLFMNVQGKFINWIIKKLDPNSNCGQNNC